jgi:hypothetical protein
VVRENVLSMASRRTRTKKSSTLVFTSKRLVPQSRKVGKSRKGGATKTAPNRIPTQAPTMDAVQRAFQRIAIAGPRQQMSEYMHCRMDPYTSKGQTAIPDGRNNKFVVVDHFMADTITCNSTAGFTISTFPFLPYTGGITGNGGTSAHDITVNGVSFANSPPGPGNGLYPVGVPKEWLAWINASFVGIAQNDPYVSSGARIVSVTRRLIYLSAATTATGLITVTPQKISAVQDQSTNSVTSSGVYGTLTDPTTAGVLTAPVNTSIVSVDYSSAPGSSAPPPFDRSSVTTRVENGVLINGKHLGDKHRITPVYDNVAFPCANTTLAGSSQAVGLFTTSSPGVTNGGGIVWHDDEWESQQISVTGVLTGANFRFETILCMEYTVGINSPVYAFSKSPTKPDLPLVQAVESKVNSMPVARPGVTV